MILFALAAACNAVGDKLAHHFTSSVFKNLDPYFWDPMISWKNKWVNGKRRKLIGPINYPVQLTDAWHFFKSLMLVFLGFAVAFHTPIYNPVADAGIYLGIWWLTFEFLYSCLFVNKN